MIQSGSAAAPLVLDSGSESDGESALRKSRAANVAHGACRGPPNRSMLWFHDPVPVVDPTHGMRWEFLLDFDVTYLVLSARSVPRTIKGKNAQFDHEPTLPKLNNLATHVKDCEKKLADAKDSDDETEDENDMEGFNLRRSVQFMESYLKEGRLRPDIMPTKRGFLRLFAAWILDESLPWTTGEAPSLAVLFKYLKVTYQLPSDTESKIAMTCDNASVNNVLMETVCRYLLSLYGIPYNPDSHIRCIAHVINLVVQAILAGLDEADDPDLFDYFEELNKSLPIHYD
ncbi:hypothetical protein DFP72DRAFT_810841, partial [Ephemerocybe angulata]